MELVIKAQGEIRVSSYDPIEDEVTSGTDFIVDMLTPIGLIRIHRAHEAIENLETGESFIPASGSRPAKWQDASVVGMNRAGSIYPVYRDATDEDLAVIEAVRARFRQDLIAAKKANHDERVKKYRAFLNANRDTLNFSGIAKRAMMTQPMLSMFVDGKTGMSKDKLNDIFRALWELGAIRDPKF